MNPKISIIIPAHNAEQYLKDCVESIMKNGYDNLEVIIIDDSSKDKTPLIIDELKSEFDCIISKRIDACGVSRARNTALEMITGDFFCFVDADDRLLPGMLSELFSLIEETDADVAGCQFKRFTSESEYVEISMASSGAHESYPHSCFSPSEYLKQQLLHENTRCWSKLYRASTLAKLRFSEDFSIGEDILFLMEVLQIASKLAETSYPGYAYFINPAGAMLKPFEPKYFDQISSWEIIKNQTEKINSDLSPLATRHYLMAIMLVAGKLAETSRNTCKDYNKYANLIHSKLKAAIKTSVGQSAFKLLPKDYKIKCKFYIIAPFAYLWLYSFHKYKH